MAEENEPKEKDGCKPSAPVNYSTAEMIKALMDADKIAEAIDQAVVAGWLNSRSTIADARLCYGEPFVYKWKR